MLLLVLESGGHRIILIGVSLGPEIGESLVMEELFEGVEFGGLHLDDISVEVAFLWNEGGEVD